MRDPHPRNEAAAYTRWVSRILLFDVDQTLINAPGVGRSAIDDAFLELHGLANATAGIRFDGRTDRAILNDVFERMGMPGHERDEAFARTNGRYLELLPPMMTLVGGDVLPGALELLAALQLEGALMGVATGNSKAGARVKLEHFGMWEFFAGGGFGELYAERHLLVREAIDDVARAGGVLPSGEATIVIGDTPHDIDAAVINGARTLAVATGRYSEDELLVAGATWTAPDLRDTSGLVRLLLDE